MLKKIKNLICIGSVLVLILLTSTVAFAEEVVDPGAVVTPEEQEVYTTAVQEYTQAPEPVTQAPVYTQAPDPETQAPVYTQAPEVYTEYYTQEQVESYSFYEEPTEFQNQQDAYEEETTEATEQNTSLYKDVKDIDDTELKKKNWANIAEELKKANEKDKKSNSSPFDYIKNSEKETGFFAWLHDLPILLIIGICCFIASVISLIVFIVLTKKNKKGGKPDKTDNKPNKPNRPTNGKTDSQGYYIPPSQREKSDYGDDYSSDLSRYDELIEPRKAVKKKKVSEATGEVVIPDSYRKF